ncbi:acyl-CoA dehydrogenase family protein [Stigmatella sp. ncwal1]|uniref:Acyl-CoA dehydrogenase family protein n=1 Tax=Stigmatella ashevillensis TaxID=2995309 RepID=A0ABT5DQE2_9BACT|nr:acyl-CoA dehydrogenase family protein [Stigmatella ashevillena]MDC0714602.1 acyl-CoA dehydrogenase family protein [Stigmatella ashevillena]
MDDLLRFLLTAPLPQSPLRSVEEWWPQHRDIASRFPAVVDVALAGGFLSDRLAFAFASGYQAALRALWPELPADRRAALCATEAGGGHPSAIQTHLSRGTEAGPWRVTGEKTFVTLGTAAEVLLVVASEGRDAQGRNRLRVVKVDAHREGVRLSGMAPLPFVPELPHGQVRLEAVALSAGEVLPGDGYAHYLKPFRTVEDCHVQAALLGWLIQVARRSNWPGRVRDEVLAVAVAIRALALADPSSEAVHVALGGVLDLIHRLLEGLAPWWPTVEADTRERWERDKGLLELAGKARAKRREVAQQWLAGSSATEP